MWQRDSLPPTTHSMGYPSKLIVLLTAAPDWHIMGLSEFVRSDIVRICFPWLTPRRATNYFYQLIRSFSILIRFPFVFPSLDAADIMRSATHKGSSYSVCLIFRKRMSHPILQRRTGAAVILTWYIVHSCNSFVLEYNSPGRWISIHRPDVRRRCGRWSVWHYRPPPFSAVQSCTFHTDYNTTATDISSIFSFTTFIH